MTRTPPASYPSTVRATLALMRGSLGRLVRYDIIFKAAGALVLSPLAGLLLDALLSRSGSASVTNADIAAFALSLPGLFFLTITACLALAANFAEQAGLLIVLRPRQPRRSGCHGLVRTVASERGRFSHRAIDGRRRLA